MNPSIEAFNEVKYKSLMDGLECSEILKTQLENTKRLDSEYYQKKYLYYQSLVERCHYSTLGRMADFLIGPFGSAYNTENYVQNSGYRYVRGQDVKPFVLKNDDVRYMSFKDFQRLEKYCLKKNDILISVVGTLGNACIVQEKDIPAIFSCKSTVIRAIGVNPYFLLTYLNSKFGQGLLIRKERGAIQKGLNLGDLESLCIPIVTDNIQNLLEVMIKHALKNIDRAVKTYHIAENILYDRLEIGSYTSSIPLISSIKLFSESFAVSGRLDAEYYQPKYDVLFQQLLKFQTKLLGGTNGIATIRKSIEPGSAAYQDNGIPFVRVSDVSKWGISDPDIHLPEDIVENVSSLFPEKNTILFSKDGSVGIAYKIEENVKMITSGALLHLIVHDETEVLPDYLTLVLNSPIVQLQAERDSNGAIIQHWKPSEIENVVIPILDMDIQRKIAMNIQKSFSLRRKSELMLKDAKRLVEIVIEQDEKSALDWLKENCCQNVLPK